MPPLSPSFTRKLTQTPLTVKSQVEHPSSTELHHHLLTEATVHEKKKKKIMLLFLFLSILSFYSSSLSLNQEGLYLQQTKLSLSDPDSALSGTERPVRNRDVPAGIRPDLPDRSGIFTGTKTSPFCPGFCTGTERD